MIVNLITQQIVKTLTNSADLKFKTFSLNGVSDANTEKVTELLIRYGIESLVLENHLLCRFTR